MKNERIINPQSYAHPFEKIMCKVFECSRGGVGGIVNADFIRHNPKAAVIATLTYLYNSADNVKRAEIEELIQEVNFYFQFDFDTLLSFETSKKLINGCTYELSYPNGEEAIKSIEDKFRSICR